MFVLVIIVLYSQELKTHKCFATLTSVIWELFKGMHDIYLLAILLYFPLQNAVFSLYLVRGLSDYLSGTGSQE